MHLRRFKRRDGVVCREVAGETFLVPIHGHLADLSELFVLNEVGAEVWDCLEEECSLEDLAERLCTVFEVQNEQALTDAEAFVRDLVDAGLADEAPVAVV